MPERGDIRAGPALIAAREAAARCRGLARDSCQHTAALAGALDVLARCLRAAGEHLEALEVAQEACLLHRELAALGEPLRMDGLSTSDRASDRAFDHETLELQRSLVQLWELGALSRAHALEQVARLLQAAGRHAQARAARQRAAEMRRQLSLQRLGLCVRELAEALDALGQARPCDRAEGPA